MLLDNLQILYFYVYAGNTCLEFHHCHLGCKSLKRCTTELITPYRLQTVSKKRSENHTNLRKNIIKEQTSLIQNLT